jgi:hypothetical protein
MNNYSIIIRGYEKSPCVNCLGYILAHCVWDKVMGQEPN